MADSPRIDELRRRLQKDPASIAFAQLAEEYRRTGRFADAIETCRAGLKRHGGYLSARVTLGRALLESGDLNGAQAELNDVLRTAPQNLAAIRGLAEVHRQRGELGEALERYRAAFELAQNDPGIDQIVRDLRRELSKQTGARLTPAPGHIAAARVPSHHDTAQAARRPEPAPDPARARALGMVAELEQWLEAILTDRRTRLYGLQA